MAESFSYGLLILQLFDQLLNFAVVSWWIADDRWERSIILFGALFPSIFPSMSTACVVAQENESSCCTLWRYLLFSFFGLGSWILRLDYLWRHEPLGSTNVQETNLRDGVQHLYFYDLVFNGYAAFAVQLFLIALDAPVPTAELSVDLVSCGFSFIYAVIETARLIDFYNEGKDSDIPAQSREDEVGLFCISFSPAMLFIITDVVFRVLSFACIWRVVEIDSWIACGSVVFMHFTVEAVNLSLEAFAEKEPELAVSEPLEVISTPKSETPRYSNTLTEKSDSLLKKDKVMISLS